MARELGFYNRFQSALQSKVVVSLLSWVNIVCPRGLMWRNMWIVGVGVLRAEIFTNLTIILRKSHVSFCRIKGRSRRFKPAHYAIGWSFKTNILILASCLHSGRLQTRCHVQICWLPRYCEDRWANSPITKFPNKIEQRLFLFRFLGKHQNVYQV
jgi:hypothetical protein